MTGTIIIQKSTGRMCADPDCGEELSPRLGPDARIHPLCALPVRTALYWHYDGCSALLYVGISKQPAARAAQHAEESMWVRFAVRSEAVWFDTRPEAERAEIREIIKARPLFNVKNSLRDVVIDRCSYLAQHGVPRGAHPTSCVCRKLVNA